MGKEVKIKIKDAAKLQFELEENATAGDWFDLNQVNKCDLSSVEQALLTKKQEVEAKWAKEWVQQTTVNAINAFKNSEQYQSLVKENQQLQNQLTNKDKEFAIEKNDLTNTIKKNETAVQLKINKAIEEFKNSPEFLNLQQELVNLRKENTQLQDKVNTEKDVAIKEYLQSNEYKQLENAANNLKVDNSLLREQAKQVAKDAIDEFKKGQEYTTLVNELTSLKAANIKLQEQKANAIAQYIASDDYKKITSELTNLKVSNEQLKSQNEQLQKDKKELVATEQIKIDNAILKQKEKIENDFYDHSERVEELRKNIQNLTKENQIQLHEIASLKFAQREKTNKVIGEELEQWIIEQYNDKLSMVLGSSVTFEKANKVKARENAKGEIEKTKPDFLFTVYQKSDKAGDKPTVIGRVVIEAKNQRYDTKEENHTLNSSFYDKLAIDCKNNKGTFAVLVTTLEAEKEFSVYLAQGYPNMFVVRPEWLMSLLSLLNYIIIQQAKFNASVGDLKVKLDKEKLMKKFDDFRDNLLDNAIDNIAKNLEKIEDCANTIKDRAQDILNSKRVLIESHFQTIRNKIEHFNLKYMCDKIDEINELEKENAISNSPINKEELINSPTNDESNSSSNE